MKVIDSHSEAEQLWDTIIVGTGMGGATLGYALAKAGQRVLFCEQGRARVGSNDGYRGLFAEEFLSTAGGAAADREEIFARAGRYVEKIEDYSGTRMKEFLPYIGAGGGGSSALYGMALERFFPSDFQPRSNYPDAQYARLPESWPISYEEFLPFYESAERLYRVRGSADPLRADPNQFSLSAPPDMQRANQELFTHCQDQGLHPYRLPLACEFVDGCTGCQGHLCAKGCKNDSARICLSPALEDYGARIMERCRALRIEASTSRFTSLECDWNGTAVRLKGKRLVLAAGALQTPLLLLNSTSKYWPSGLANQSGVVGKYLMRHCIDLYAIKTEPAADPEQNLKELAFNDFYVDDGVKLGSVQSFGPMPPPRVILEEMAEMVANDYGKFAASGVRLMRPVLASVIKRMFSSRVVLASIMEDLPLEQNRVGPGTNRARVSLRYSLAEAEKKRAAIFREKMQRVLSPYRYSLLKQTEDNLRIAHACGTCRFGNDERNSVLNRYNRAHTLDNLYIVDSSFFPSSGGTNPALTIAANALRVAESILSGSD